MTGLDNPNAPHTDQRSWFAKNWYWCLLPVPVVFGAFLLFRPFFHAGYADEDKHETVQLIEQFHGRMNAGQFAQIYDDSHVDFKGSNTRDDLIKAMQGTQAKWGQFREVTFSELNEIIGPQIQVRAVYNSTFEKGAATEEFVFVRQGSKIQLAMYNVFDGAIKPDTASKSTDLALAQTAAGEFYQRLAAKDYGAVWDAAHADLKNSASREQLIDMMQQLSKKIGACGAPLLVDTDHAIQNKDHFVGLIYRRKCEHAEVQERLTWKIVDGKALLRGYH